MKVLVLPFNIASKGALTIDALNRIEGIEARGIFVNKNEQVAKSEFARQFEVYSFKKKPIAWSSTFIRKSIYFYKMIKWADVLHWIWDSGFSSQWDLKFVKHLKKPGIIEWSGSDIRSREMAEKLNPYMKLIYDNGYEYAHIETLEKSNRIQEKFAKLHFYPVTTPEMNLYIKKDLFPLTYLTLHRLNVKQFEPLDPGNARPVVVHAPTRRVAKGTNYILDAVYELKKEFDFEFRLLENMSRYEAMRQVQQCDIFVDQLFLGSHGLSSCEAMSFGKPVLCYIMPAVYENGLPAECPIVNVTIETIKEELKKLIINREARIELGKRGREYAEIFLDVDNQVKKLVNIYEEVIKKAAIN